MNNSHNYILSFIRDLITTYITHASSHSQSLLLREKLTVLHQQYLQCPTYRQLHLSVG